MKYYSKLTEEEQLKVRQELLEHYKMETIEINGTKILHAQYVLKGIKTNYCCAYCWENFYNCCCGHVD